MHEGFDEKDLGWETPQTDEEYNAELLKKKNDFLSRELAIMSQYRAEHPRLGETLEAIDFTFLKELFRERLSRTDPFDAAYLTEHFPFAEKERIIPITNDAPFPKSAANAHVEKMLITVTVPPSPPPLPAIEMPITQQPLSAEVERDMKRDAVATLFHTVVHEETHIVSSEIADNAYQSEDPIFYRSGFETGRIGKSGEESFQVNNLMYRSLNEGVTESIAREIGREYIRRHGVGDITISDWDKHPVGAYEKEVLFVEAMTELVACNAGVPKDVVMRALQEAYFTGRRSALRSIAPALESLANQDILLTISQLSGEANPADTTSVRELLRNMLKTGKLSADLAAKIEAAVPPPPPFPGRK